LSLSVINNQPSNILMIIFVFSMIFICLSSIDDSAAAEWNVTPGGSIQTAINYAGENDTINVKNNGTPYTYYENVVVNKTGLTI